MRWYPRALRAAQGDGDARRWLLRRALCPAERRRTIIACDFDGTLCQSDYPAILRPNRPLLSALRLMKEMGYCLILWTCRGGEDLQAAVDWLGAQGLAFDCVNENSPEIIRRYDFDSRKVFADEYWDDKSVAVALPEEETP